MAQSGEVATIISIACLITRCESSHDAFRQQSPTERSNRMAEKRAKASKASKTKKPQIKVRDLKSGKDAKGGRKAFIGGPGA
jgi:hypothetical protein